MKRVVAGFILLLFLSQHLASGVASNHIIKDFGEKKSEKYKEKLSPGLLKKIEITAEDEELPIIIFYEEKKKARSAVTVESSIKVLGGKIKHKYTLVKAISARLPAGKIKKLAESTEIKRIYPDEVVRLSIFSSNTSAKLETSVKAIGADYAWETLGYDGSGITVAVVDTGIDYTHPDLGGGFGQGYKVKGGYDFVNEDTDPKDDNGHGTHVAGIIAANGTVKGVAPGASLLAVKVLNAHGSGYSSDVIAGIDWAVFNGADIISLSLGSSDQPNDEFESPINLVADEAVARGVIVVVAAGNEGPGTGTVDHPGAASKVITVGASDDKNTVSILDDSISAISSRGPSAFGRLDPDLVAPGVSINSTYLVSNGSYAVLSGTSMATPHVAGAAALLLQKNASLTPTEIRSILMRTASAVPNAHIFEQGAGVINVTRALLQRSSAFINGDDRWEVTVPHGFSSTAELVLENDNNAGVTYFFNLQELFDLEGDNYLSPSKLFFPQSVYLQPYSRRAVDVIFSSTGDENASIYGGVLNITTNSSDSLMIPIVINIPLLGSGFITGTVDDSDGSLEAGDWIYYNVKTHNGTSLTASINWSNPAYDLDLYLFAPNGELVNSSNSSDQSLEQVTLSDMVYHEYWLAIHNYNSHGTKVVYELTITYDSKLYVEPDSWQVKARRGEVKNATFSLINNGAGKAVNLSVMRLSLGTSGFTSGTLENTGEYYRVIWNSSGIDVKNAHYLNATLVWNDPAKDLDMMVAYYNGTGWSATRFLSAHDNKELGEARESLENVDIQYYIKTYGEVGIAVKNYGSSADYNLTVNFTELVPWEAATVSPSNLTFEPIGNVTVNISINTTPLEDRETYDAVFIVSNATEDFAIVPVRVKVLPIVVNQTTPADVEGYVYYSSIQNAIDDVNSAFSTIYVSPGTYIENLDVNAGVKIISSSGPNSTFIKPSTPYDHVIDIKGDYAIISGFTIQDANKGYAGIYVRVNNSQISNSIIKGNYFGVYFNSSSGNVLLGNTFDNIWDYYSTSSSVNNSVINCYINQTRVTFKATDVAVTSVASPPPVGDELFDIGKFVNITNTSNNSWISLNIYYDSSEVGRITESTLGLYRFNGTEWGRVEGSGVNLSEKYVYANISEFSVFAPLGKDLPPAISQVEATSITTTSALIIWKTDEESDSLVKYGTRTGDYIYTERDYSNVTSHQVQLTDLNPSTKYYFVVNSTDKSGNSNQSGEYTFTTTAQAIVAVGGGGVAPTKEIVTEPGRAVITLPSIPAGKTEEIVFPSTEDFYFTRLEITTKKTVSDVEITISTLYKKPQDLAEDIEGIVYRYIKVTPKNLRDEDIFRVNIYFKVEKSWIKAGNIDPASIFLARYKNGEWRNISTVKIEEDAESIYYSAVSPGLSIFAISGVPIPIVTTPPLSTVPPQTFPPVTAEAPSQTEAPKMTPQPLEIPMTPPPEIPRRNITGIFFGVIALVGVVGYLFRKALKKKLIKR